MSNFTPLVEKEYEYEGDTIIVKFSRLKRKHMLKAMPALSRVKTALQDLPEGLTVENIESLTPEVLDSMNDFLNDVVDALPDHVAVFSGLKDSNGNEISIETVVDDFYFTPLAFSIAMDMVKNSSPTSEGN